MSSPAAVLLLFCSLFSPFLCSAEPVQSSLWTVQRTSLPFCLLPRGSLSKQQHPCCECAARRLPCCHKDDLVAACLGSIEPTCCPARRPSRSAQPDLSAAAFVAVLLALILIPLCHPLPVSPFPHLLTPFQPAITHSSKQPLSSLPSLLPIIFFIPSPKPNNQNHCPTCCPHLAAHRPSTSLLL